MGIFLIFIFIIIILILLIFAGFWTSLILIIVAGTIFAIVSFLLRKFFGGAVYNEI